MKLKTVVYWSQLDRDYWRREIAARSADGTTFRPCDGTVNCMTGRNRAFEMVGVDSRLFVKVIARPSIQPVAKRWPDVEVFIELTSP